MNRILAVSVTLCAAAITTQPLFAGPEPLPGKEMKTMAEPTLEPSCNWTGFYLGMDRGWADGEVEWIDADHDTFPDTTFDTEPAHKIGGNKPSGFISGVQLGYNFQIGWFVIGAEGDFSYADVHARDLVYKESTNDSFETHHDWGSSAVLRVGVAWKHFLLYAKGGAAFPHFSYSLKHYVPQGIDDSGSLEFFHIDTFHTDEVRVCPIVGVGIEYALTCDWSAKLEYAHLFVGRDAINGTMIDDGVPEHETFDTDLDMDTVRIGLNYKFSSFGAHRSPSLTMAGVERIDTKAVAPLPGFAEECKWTGFYFGAHAGWADGESEWIDADRDTFPNTTPDTEPAHKIGLNRPSGFIGGGQVGYNFQFGSFVVGAEGEFSYADVHGRDLDYLESVSNDFQTHNDWVGTAALRAGFAWKKFMIYAKGGGAFPHFSYSLKHYVPTGRDDAGMQEFFHIDTFHTDEVRPCPLVGGGLEYALTCHWSTKLEYTHLFLGRDAIDGTMIDDGVPEHETFDIAAHQDTVRFGLNYKF